MSIVDLGRLTPSAGASLSALRSFFSPNFFRPDERCLSFSGDLPPQPFFGHHGRCRHQGNPVLGSVGNAGRAARTIAVCSTSWPGTRTRCVVRVVARIGGYRDVAFTKRGQVLTISASAKAVTL